jgi:hypothetical protein
MTLGIPTITQMAGATQPVLPSPAVSAQRGPVCRLCGSAPAADVTFLSHTGMIIFARFGTSPGAVLPRLRRGQLPPADRHHAGPRLVGRDLRHRNAYHFADQRCPPPEGGSARAPRTCARGPRAPAGAAVPGQAAVRPTENMGCTARGPRDRRYRRRQHRRLRTARTFPARRRVHQRHALRQLH